jgi:hypothetical protein
MSWVGPCMTKNRFIFTIFLLIVSLWWGWTFLVDFFIIRTVFSVIDNFFQAGDLGLAVFTKLNNLELILSSTLVAVLSYQCTNNRKAFPLLILSVLAWIIPITYLTYLTPKLLVLTELWKKADQMGIIGIAGITDIQLEHQFFHQLYISVDSFKLILLSVIIFYGSIKQDKWT